MHAGDMAPSALQLGRSTATTRRRQPLWQALYDMQRRDRGAQRPRSHLRALRAADPGAVADPVRGIRQFVVGTGGRSHYGFGHSQPNSQVRNGDTFGVLSLTLKPGGYDWQFVPEAGRTFTDNGSDVCHDANGPVSGSGNPINTSLVTAPAYTDTPVTAGVAYNYTVTAVDNAGHESGPSNQASATADPPASGATALDFDGVDDHVALGPASGLDSNTFTVEPGSGGTELGHGGDDLRSRRRLGGAADGQGPVRRRHDQLVHGRDCWRPAGCRLRERDRRQQPRHHRHDDHHQWHLVPRGRDLRRNQLSASI